MTKRDAENLLEQEFGTRELLIQRWNATLSAKVVKAIELLGGKYQPDWGLTRLPPLWKLGRLPRH